jgi:alpha-amylase
VTATQGWLCEHRRPFVRRLLAFRKETAGTPGITNAWDDGANQLAFGRGAAGFVVINNGAAALTRTFSTSLAAGDYCDVYQGSAAPAGCTATRVTVDAAGMANLTVPPHSALVIHRGAQPGTPSQ